ncbi:MAG: hypothetical protein E7232_06635 [Lachnospiraceae bacterium]|nr:hypothetical protein [Lachnospiraceae bacterium]
MSAKEYLSQIYLLDAEIKQNKKRIAELDSDIGRLKAIDYSGDKVQSSGDKDTLTDGVSKLLDLQRKVAKEMIELQFKKQKITSEIRQLPKADHVTLLTMRYVNCERWERIATDMNLTMRRVLQIHGNALSIFEKINMI